MTQASNEIIYVSHPVMFRNKPLAFIFYLLTTPILIGIIGLTVWYLACLANKLSITTKQIHLEKGLLSKERTEVNIDSIRTVNVKQTMMNRIFDTGQVSISTIGDRPEIVLSGLPRPNDIRSIIHDAQSSKE